MDYFIAHIGFGAAFEGILAQRYGLRSEPWGQGFDETFGAFCLDVRTLTFCQLINKWVFPIEPLKVNL